MSDRLMRNMRLWLWLWLRLSLATTLLFGLCWSPATRAGDAPLDTMHLLRKADLARGGGQSGMVWVVHVRHVDGENDGAAMVLRVKASGTASVAETLEPLRSKGSKMLQVGRSMWLSKPGLRKPVPISPRQRLTGQAAIGDIAAANYARDYAVVSVRDDKVRDEDCHLLQLRSVDRLATYDQVLYWVSQSRGVAVRAEFLSLSGKRLKVADFAYDNLVKRAGKELPFISEMTIADDLTGAHTILHYDEVRVRNIPDSEFDVGQFE